MYDLKPSMPDEIRGKYQPVSTNLPGLQLSDQLPKLSQCADKFSLIRSMHSYSSEHGQGDFHMMCGSPEDKNIQPPGIGAVLSWQQKQQAPVPPFVHLGNMKHPAHSAPGYGGFLGRTYDPFLIDQDADEPGFAVKEFDAAADVDVDRLSGRSSLLRSLDRYQSAQERQLEFSLYHNNFREQALNLATSRQAKEAFDLAQEPDKLRDAYGRNRVGQGMLLARRLIEAGVRFVTIQGYVDTGIYAWDHHWGIFSHLEQQLPIYDSSYSALLNDLDDRGMLDTTLVITAGEFGRTPKLNKDKQGPGRDHWGRCFSLTLGGGGVKTGQVIGASDKFGAVPTERPVSVPDFVATVYHALGLNPHAEFLSQGRPMQMLPQGEVVHELF
jgi:arylsulfatase A-like enzyme